MSKKVVIAMSGGVDSSVAALLLGQAGLEVRGVFMQLGSQSNADPARAVARHLEIDFEVWNLQEQFHHKVIEPFIAEYLEGRTPNPCVICNREIKFNALLEKSIDAGADYLATGHYARIVPAQADTPARLMRAKNHTKDQSYFLFNLTGAQLEQVIFPLAEYSKDRVRELAREHDLPVNSQESQDICFIENGHYADFIEAELGKQPAPGNIVDEQGRVMGRHRGLYRYTVGQRKGLDLALPEPVYILKLDPQRNEVVVGPEDKSFSHTMNVSGLSWVAGRAPKDLEQIQVKIRYKSPLKPAALEILTHDSVTVRFHQPQRAITPGQAAVFYKDEQVLGGGFIKA